MNTRGQNDILATAVKVHDKALINPHDLQITNIALDHIVLIIIMEVEDAL